MVGLLLAATIFSANYIADNSVVIIIMLVAFFGQGICNLGWTVVADIASKNRAGLTGGVFNFCTNLAGILTPIVIGTLVSATRSFFGGLAYIAVLALLGILCYMLSSWATSTAWKSPLPSVRPFDGQLVTPELQSRP